MKKNITYSLIVLSLLAFSACSNEASRYVDENGVTYVDHHFFSYACPSLTQCTRTANVNMVQAEGIFVELDDAFVEKCVQDKMQRTPVNRYCKNMIELGSSNTFSSSASAIDNILKYGANPEEGSSLDSRTEAIKLKLYD